MSRRDMLRALGPDVLSSLAANMLATRNPWAIALWEILPDAKRDELARDDAAYHVLVREWPECEEKDCYHLGTTMGDDGAFVCSEHREVKS